MSPTKTPVPPPGPSDELDPDAGRVQRLRHDLPWADHVIRAYQRFSGDGGPAMAATITYYAFLSFFPIIALAVGVLTLVTSGNAGAVTTVVDQVNSFSPGLADNLQLQHLLSSAGVAQKATGFGLLGLAYAGLGWISALRQSIRQMWHQNVQVGNFVTAKLRDLLLLLGLGVLLALSLVVSAVTGSAADLALRLVHLQGSAAGKVLLLTVGPLLSLGTDVLLFGFVFTRLSRVGVRWKLIGRSALLASVLFEILKRVGGVYISHSTSNPVFGPFAVVIGLLVWIFLISQMVMFCAAWACTAPFDSDVPPSGTSSAEAAEQAGIPVTFTSADPDRPPMLTVKGSPTPLREAVRGRADEQMAPSDWDPETVEQARHGAGRPAASTVTVRERAVQVVREHEDEVRQAQERARRVGAGAGAVAGGAVTVSVLRLVAGLRKR